MPHPLTVALGAPRHRLQDTPTVSRALPTLLAGVALVGSLSTASAEPADVAPVAGSEVLGPTFVPLPTPMAASGHSSPTEPASCLRPSDAQWELTYGPLPRAAAPAHIAHVTKQGLRAHPRIAFRQLLPGSVPHCPHTDEKGETP